MFQKFKVKVKPEGSSDFSVFIRTASAREKKRVYSKVIKKSIDDQKKLMESATTE